MMMAVAQDEDDEVWSDNSSDLLRMVKMTSSKGNIEENGYLSDSSLD